MPARTTKNIFESTASNYESDKTMTGQRVGLVYPFANLDTVPSLCDTIQLLSEQGYGVDVFTSVGQGFKAPRFEGNVNVFIIQSLPSSIHGLQSKVRAGLGHIGVLAPIKSVLKKSRAVFRRVSSSLSLLKRAAEVRGNHRKQAYSCFIGVDPAGLKEAQLLTRFIKVPLAYYSLELLLSSEIVSDQHRDLKKQEIDLSRRAKFVIIQDSERAALMADDNNIPMEKFALVPNAPVGPARIKSSSYWHEKFNLPTDRRIVLHAGSLQEWTGIEEIVKSVGSWPEEWVLVVHSRYDGEARPELDKLRALAVAGKTFFSLEPVARQQYEELVDSADIGIAFYLLMPGSPYTQRNLESIGLSSGKISYYLRAGLPAITNRATSLGKFIETEGCGLAVDSGHDLGQAILKISRDYKEYSRRSLTVFNEHLDFSKRFDEVLGRLHEVVDD